MFNLFTASPLKFYKQIVKEHKKYADIAACDSCRRNKKLCRFFCRYNNKKYVELVEDRRKENKKMKKLKNMLLESTHWFLNGLALGTGFVAALFVLSWVL